MFTVSQKKHKNNSHPNTKIPMNKNGEFHVPFINSLISIALFVVFSLFIVRAIVHLYPAPFQNSYEYTTTQSGEKIIKGFFR